MKSLIVGLGNIGEKYKNTRHNIGFDVVDYVSKNSEAHFKTDKLGDVANFKKKGKSIFLLKPSTYMNLSGNAVRYWKNFLKIDIKDILIVTDDLSLEVGKMKIKPKGSSAGHNGLFDIEEKLLTQEYSRMKVGIGRDFAKGAQSEYVLGKFSQEERVILDEKMKLFEEVVYAFCLSGLDFAMNNYNKS